MRLGFAWLVAGLYVSALPIYGADGEKKGTPNRLAKSKSPYLLQHAYNPVDWYPWGKEAFEKAHKEKKPILLSIGYSTCHWCHVMERESFQNKEVADFLNKHFISIKLDREERPDVDAVYMTSFQAMSGGQGGGWPLNMFLTPELNPFYGGTYFPPEDKPPQPSFMRILTAIEKKWRTERKETLEIAGNFEQKFAEFIAENQKLTAKEGDVSPALLEGVPAKMLESADLVNGGWGKRQKFPQASQLRFLLRHGGMKEREFALKTCRNIIAGGIHDQIGGGIHRYTVDPIWLVPHFEKMLYDQAQVLEVFVEAWQVSKDERFRVAAVGIAEYVLDQLTHPQGGFYSAQDAQSEGKEGKFWCWTEKELKALLSPAELKIARRWFGFTAKGNFVDHSDPEHLKDQNVLFRAEPDAKLSKEEKANLDKAIAKMQAVRNKRVPPATDDKILASWNGLMIGAMASAGRQLGETRYLDAARKAHAFVKAKLWNAKTKTLSHRWREDDVDGSQLAESYLFLLKGTRVLYEATLEAEYLEFGIVLAEKAQKLFYDEKNGGFFDGEERDDLFVRLKSDFDSATPTPSSVACLEYALLAEITGRESFDAVARKSLQSVVPTLKRSPSSLAESLVAVDYVVGKPARLVIVGGKRVEEFLKAAWKGVRHNLLVIGTEGPVDDFTSGLKPEDGKTTAYYCVKKTCRMPQTDPAIIEKWAKEDRRAISSEK